MEVARQYTQKLKALEIICTCEMISGKERSEEVNLDNTEGR